MSKEIDWSKAPEGATHYAPKREENCMWRAVFWRIEDGRGVEAWSVNDDDSLQYYEKPTWIASDIGRLIERPSFASWTGTGLPPVGTVCEFYSEEDEEWLEGKIIAHGVDEGRKWAIMQCDDAVWMGEDHEFRVKRTSEQIAAEEREMAIKEIASMIGRGTFSEDASRIYDAGYRKTEAGK